MNFGEKLSSARKEKGLSQEELAQKIFITRQALSRWENNTAQPSLEMFSMLCDLLGKTPAYFLEGDQKPPRNYRALEKGEKKLLWTQCAQEAKMFKGYGLRYFFFSLLLDLGAGLFMFFLLNFYVTGLWGSVANESKIFSLIGAGLLALCAVFLMLLNSYKASMRFNLWLLKTHSIVRTANFLFL